MQVLVLRKGKKRWRKGIPFPNTSQQNTSLSHSKAKGKGWGGYVHIQVGKRNIFHVSFAESHDTITYLSL